MPGLKTAGNIVLYTAGELIPRILSFLLLPVLTHYLTPNDYGISSYITTVLSFLLVLTSLSVNTYALRTYYKLNTVVEKKQLLGNLFIFLSGWAFLFLLIEMTVIPLLLRTFDIRIPFYPYFFIALIINFFDVIALIPLVSYRVHDDAKRFVLLSVGRTVIQYILILFFVAYLRQGLYGSFTGRLLGAIPFGIIYFLIIKKKGTFNFKIKQVKDALIFSLPLLPGALSYLIISMLDRIILERYVSLTELGLYSVASTLSLTLNVVIQGIYRSFEQKVFREHNTDGYQLLTDKLFRTYLAALCIPGFAMILFSKQILLFFTSSQFYPAQQYVVYLVTAVIISGLNTFFTTLLIADNRRKVVTYSSLVAAAVSLVGNILLIKYFGVWGACIASILSFFVVYLFYINKVDLMHKYIFNQLSFVLIFFAAAYFIPASIPATLAIAINFVLLGLFTGYILKAFKVDVSFLTSITFLNTFRSNYLQNKNRS